MHLYEKVLMHLSEMDVFVMDTRTVYSILCVIWELGNERHHP